MLTENYNLLFLPIPKGSEGPSYGMERMDGSRFSTKDQDNDAHGSMHCTNHFETYGGWWFKDCFNENMNGQYYDSYTQSTSGIVWQQWKGSWETMKETWLMIRPRSFTDFNQP